MSTTISQHGSAFDYDGAASRVAAEIQAVLKQVDHEQFDALVDVLMVAQKVFIFGVGRVFLSLQCLGKRLGHLGIDCQVVGAINEKPIGPQDVLLVASGSGESRLPVEIARIAKSRGATIALITSAEQSTLKSLSDAVLRLPCPTKTDALAGAASTQPMTSLFDQALHIIGDLLAMAIQQACRLQTADLWRNHANLE